MSLTIWGVVNCVNVLQSIGFLSRVRAGSMLVNHYLGYVILALAIPAALALGFLLKAKAGLIKWIGSAVFLAFVVLMSFVDYIRPTEFRSPSRLGILVPYLFLFFGSILLMGFPMFRTNRNLWLVTVATSTLLVGSMVAAMLKGVG